MKAVEGVRHKPDHCKLCKLGYSSSGFCPDYNPLNNVISVQPKMMLLLEQPFSSDIIEQNPLSGKMGDWFEWKVLKPLGLLKKNLLISNVLRCKSLEYPLTNIRKLAESTCRFYDKNIREFDPDCFVFSYGISDTFSDPAFLALLIEDLKKGLRLANEGKRVCVCMGQNAVNLIDTLPFKKGKGGLRMWRGNYKFCKWPF